MRVQPDSTRFVERHSRVEGHFLAVRCQQSGISGILSLCQDIYFSVVRSSFSHIRKVLKNSGYITSHNKEFSPQQCVSVQHDKLKALAYLYRFRQHQNDTEDTALPCPYPINCRDTAVPCPDCG